MSNSSPEIGLKSQQARQALDAEIAKLAVAVPWALNVLGVVHGINLFKVARATARPILGEIVAAPIDPDEVAMPGSQISSDASRLGVQIARIYGEQYDGQRAA